MIQTKAFKGLQGLIISIPTLCSQYQMLRLNTNTHKVEWMDATGTRTLDMVSFCCQDLVDRIIDLSPISAQLIPTWAELFQMITTNMHIYVEQMREILSFVKK